MRCHLALALTLLSPIALAQTPKSPAPASLRSTLLAQLRSTHNQADWFVPLNTAVAGLTPEQARWIPTDAAGKLDPDIAHSVGMIANHLLFYNTRALARLRNEKAQDAPADNEETFNRFDASSWTRVVHDLDTVMTGIEDALEHADDASLAKNSALYADIATHNGYHTGQIVYVRKLGGFWDPAKGVK